jgi:dienelactone hydrolase
MVHVAVLHHALGLTDGVRRFAERLRGDGREVHTPDLFEGHTFATVEEGVAHAARIGMSELMARGATAVPAGPTPLLVVGISLGVLAAQAVAQQRSAMLGAVLVGACLPHRSLGERWPDGVPVDVHAGEDDPWFRDGGDRSAAEELVAASADARLLLHPGRGHLFVDAGLSDHDAAATDAVIASVERMLRPVSPEQRRRA